MSASLKDLRGTFLATGVGSLPHQDALEAVDFVFKAFASHVPFWPQLPRRSFYENMYVQFCEGLPGISLDEAQKSIAIDTTAPAYLEQLEACFHKIQACDVDHFAVSRPYAEGLYFLTDKLMDLNWQGWVKAQLIGPLSLGLSLLDERRKPILYNAELDDLLPSFLGLKAAWIMQRLKVHARTKVIIFIDEPYLVAVGTSQCSLPRREIIGKINKLVGVIHEGGALAGLHCCGNTDWSLVMETDIDILNFDAYGYLDKLILYEEPLGKFLKEGRILAPGIVPNSEELLSADLKDRLLGALKEHKQIFENGVFITPSCGCSGLSVELAEKAHALCADLAETIKVEIK